MKKDKFQAERRTFNCDYPVKCEISDSDLKKMTSSATSQRQLQQSDLETDSAFEQFRKFVRFWKDGRKASFKIECEDGEAFMNLSACLNSSRKTRHSPSKIRRNKLRAEMYRKKKQREINSEQLQEQIDVNNEDSSGISSHFNGNEVKEYSTVDNDYQFCSLVDDGDDDLETKFSSVDRGIEIQNRVDSDEDQGIEIQNRVDSDEVIMDKMEVGVSGENVTVETDILASDQEEIDKEDDTETRGVVVSEDATYDFDDDDYYMNSNVRWRCGYSHPDLYFSYRDADYQDALRSSLQDHWQDCYNERTGKLNLPFMNDPKYRHHFLK